jgi:glutamate N-acetyltransferase/amino-acid N-acetyltransferase
VTHWLINTGNANAGTGDQGMETARESCSAVAALASCEPAHVLPFSTGVIGEALDGSKLAGALPAAFANLAADNWERAAGAILTTDTRPKVTSRQILLGGTTVTLTGMSKGAGMIRPDMATMLAFVATDAGASPDLLDTWYRQAVDNSFNRITVDGDTSTNDAAVCTATGQSGVVLDDLSPAECERFTEALADLCLELAQAIVRDGEGATKFVEVVVAGGATDVECDAVAYTIAHSPLVKTALFASDPNWGRLLAAIGRAGLVNLQVDKVAVYINDLLIASNGARAPGYSEEAGQAAMAADDIVIRVELNRGSVQTRVWTTDFSYDYVRINAEYRT